MTQSAQRIVTIQNKKGLHARAAAKFVKTAGDFKSDITVTRLHKNPEMPPDADWVVAARSILGLMMLGAEPGTNLELKGEGEDIEQALSALEALVNDLFGEGE
jgi:phosphocarrier protein HPr